MSGPRCSPQHRDGRWPRQPAGSCVCHVVGLQRSIREWAMRQGWGGRPVHEKQARGILVAGLGMLAGYHGYGQA
jgi:hypothetical protein